MGMPATTFGLATLCEVDAQQPRPEAKRAIGIISRELDQAERPVHVADDKRPGMR